LDKIILCDFPSEDERFDILRLYYTKAHPGDVGITDSVVLALKEIARSSVYYTGADLQSVIYNAFLLAVKRNIADDRDESPVVSSADLFEAFKGFRRSLSDKDIGFQHEIRKKFIERVENSIDREMRNTEGIDMKTTLY
jgi:SpoVK/Ycf46/Vps4 family AAA+-type ATPase